eukprot:2462186-Pleurochrysis_carterae.AAC.1
MILPKPCTTPPYGPETNLLKTGCRGGLVTSEWKGGRRSGGHSNGALARATTPTTREGDGVRSF